MGSTTTDKTQRILVLTGAVSDAFGRADWQQLRALYHDDAMLCTLAAQQEILPPDELVCVLEQLAENSSVYAVDNTTVSALDEDAALVTGQIRYPLRGGGFAEGQRAWVLTYRNDLVYRSNAYMSVAKARAAYAEHGLDLGIPAGSPQGSAPAP